MEYSVVKKALKNALNESKIRLMTCGVGEDQARSFCRKIEDRPISHLVLTGWAGGLAPDLAAGEAICADAALYEGQPRLECQTLPVKGLRIGSILTVRKALLTPQEKQSARASGALAVEMEAYPLAAWAKKKNIPFNHGRVILDTLDESIPDTGEGLNPSGGVNFLPFLLHLVKHPRLLPELWRLNKRVHLVNPALEKLALELFAAIG
jgi:nucleoside phosphorylase